MRSYVLTVSIYNTLKTHTCFDPSTALMSWWQHISLFPIQPIHDATPLIIHAPLRATPEKMTTWRVNQTLPKSNKMLSKYIGVVVSASFLQFCKADGSPPGPPGFSKMDMAPSWSPPKPSNQGPSVIGVEPPPRWPISCHGVYHGVYGLCGKRRLQHMEA